MVMPSGGHLRDVRLREERREGVGPEPRLEEEDRLVGRQQYLVALESRDLLGVERRAAAKQLADGVMTPGFERNDDGDQKRRLCMKLQRGQLFDDLAHQARLGDGGDRDRSARAPLEDHRRASADALGGRPSHVNARDRRVRDLPRALEPVEPHAAGKQLELAAGGWRSSFSPDDGVAPLHTFIVGVRGVTGIVPLPDPACGKAAAAEPTRDGPTKPERSVPRTRA